MASSVAQLLIVAGEQVAVAVQGERHRGVPGPHADLLGIGANRRRTRRLLEARFPRMKRLEDFDCTVAPGVPPTTVAALQTGAFIDAGHPVVLLGDSGTGKSHLLIGLGVAACEAGRRVRLCHHRGAGQRAG
jgi:hypothetical protein